MLRYPHFALSRTHPLTNEIPVYTNFKKNDGHLDDSYDVPSLVVFSGGTAINSIALKLRDSLKRVSYILPVTDDGGSTSKIMAVIDGPAVGDVRSRCIRLANTSSSESRAIKCLLSHRLPYRDFQKAQREWYQIVEGSHPLWKDISEAYRHTIWSYLSIFHFAILEQRTRQSFDFTNGSVGNFFLVGVWMFFHSLEASILFFSRVLCIPKETKVLLSVRTEKRISLGVELEDGALVFGQNEISHPLESSQLNISSFKPLKPLEVVENVQSSHKPMPSKIRRLFFVRPCANALWKTQVIPNVNPHILAMLYKADVIIYGIGSLYTSLGPSLALQKVGETIAYSKAPKLLLLNGSHDRETEYFDFSGYLQPMSSAESVQTLVDILSSRYKCLETKYNSRSQRSRMLPDDFVTAVLLPIEGSSNRNIDGLLQLGIHTVVEIASLRDLDNNVIYDSDALVAKLLIVLAQQDKRKTTE